MNITLLSMQEDEENEVVNEIVANASSEINGNDLIIIVPESELENNLNTLSAESIAIDFMMRP